MDATGVGVLGVGYEGLELDQFVANLVAWDTVELADVRLNPMSRKKGFTRKSLSAALALAGIAYSHYPELGNPRDNRAGYGDEAPESRDRFRAVLATQQAKLALAEFADKSKSGRVVVMCFEESELRCHRREVLNALRAI
jgi:uncharacterized protein (DUF488 family)